MKSSSQFSEKSKTKFLNGFLNINSYKIQPKEKILVLSLIFSSSFFSSEKSKILLIPPILILFSLSKKIFFKLKYFTKILFEWSDCKPNINWKNIFQINLEVKKFNS